MPKPYHERALVLRWETDLFLFKCGVCQGFIHDWRQCTVCFDFISDRLSIRFRPMNWLISWAIVWHEACLTNWSCCILTRFLLLELSPRSLQSLPQLQLFYSSLHVDWCWSLFRFNYVHHDFLTLIDETVEFSPFSPWIIIGDQIWL